MEEARIGRASCRCTSSRRGKLKLEVHAICSAYVGGDALGKVEVEVASRPRDEDESEDDEESGEEVEFDDEVYESDGVESD